MKDCEKNNLFDIYMSLGIIIRGDVDELKLLMEQIKANSKLQLVFTKSSASRLRIIDD